MPLFWISLATLCGILLAPALPFSTLGWVLMAIAALILLVPPVYRQLTLHITSRFTRLTEPLKFSSPAVYPLMVLCLSMGAIRYQITRPRIDPSFIAYYNDQRAETIIDGVVVEPPDVRDDYINLRVKAQQLHSVDATQFIAIDGQLLARVSTSASFTYGDRIRLQGTLETPPENEEFSYRDYLANKGIYSYMAYPTSNLLQQGQGNLLYSLLYMFRLRALDLVYKLYPDPEASLLAGIVLGVQSGIHEDVQEAFRLTGTSHIIVISGFNITVISGLFTLLFSRLLGKGKGAVVAAIGIIIYTLLVGANAAVLRAAALGLFSLLGVQLGRRQVGLNSLAIVAAVMAMLTPSILWDVSFQLSFAATLGIMLYAEPMTNWFVKTVSRYISPIQAEKFAGPVSAYFLLTLAAQITTLPLIVYYFQRISITSLIANPLILPAQPAVMVLGGLSILVGTIFYPVGQFFAWTAWPFTAYTIRVVERLATVPHGSITIGQLAFPLVLLFYAALFSITFIRARIPSLVKRLTPAIPLSLLAITTVMIWKAASYAPDGKLHVTILDVGSGEGILIQSPSGRSVLINGGASTARLSDDLGRRLAPFDRSLDWLVVADIDNEDLAGIPGNLERFNPANVLWAGNTYGTRSASELWSELIFLSIPVTQAQVGQALDLGEGSTLQVHSIDNRGGVLLLEWDNFRLLLPMGADFDALRCIQNDSAMRNISTMLLAESGYSPLNPPELIGYLHPQMAILSVAPADKTGLPSPETLQALEGYNLLRTDENGWIAITTDGSQMWVEVEKK